jgi:hypothetical protein
MRHPFRRATSEWETERRRLFVEGYSFPPALRDRLADEYEPALSGSQVSLILEGLRSWFLACLYAREKALGMPSEAVDFAWHEFILMTREYHAFCEEAFGHYLHHSPEATMRESMAEALARTATVLDRHPAVALSGAHAGVPLLFAVDSEVGLPEAREWNLEDLERLRDERTTVGKGCSGSCTGGGSSDGGGCGASCGAGCGGG